MRVKRWLALLLTAVMMITSVNVTGLKTYAEEVSDVSEGLVSGESNDIAEDETVTLPAEEEYSDDEVRDEEYEYAEIMSG